MPIRRAFQVLGALAALAAVAGLFYSLYPKWYFPAGAGGRVRCNRVTGTTAYLWDDGRWHSRSPWAAGAAPSGDVLRDMLAVPLGAGSSGAKGKNESMAEGGDVAGRIRLSRNHQVQAGETLGTIASRYGVSVDQILRGNAFPAGTQLAAGQTLVIPLAEHVVRTTQVPRSLPSRSPPSLAETPADAELAVTPPPKKKVIGRLGTIVKPGGLIRRTPSAKGAAAYSTRPGNQLVIGGYWADWYAVVMMDGSHCWIHQKYVRLDPVDLVAGSPTRGRGSR